MTNLANLFNYISSKRPKYRAPLKFKLIHDPESITEDELTVKGDLNLRDTQITSIPDSLTVRGDLWLANTKITSLPNNLAVKGDLDLYKTKITPLPDNLTVGGDLNFQNTPLSKKYSADEIRKMIEDKGGNVKGNIYV
jgi:hypothetical protein